MTEPDDGRPRRRSRFLVLWIACATVVAVAAYCAGALVRSPWEDAVANSQRDPAVTATVKERKFVVPVALATGTTSVGATIDVIPAVSDVGRTIVTGVHRDPGATLQPGQVLVEVSGRPLIALPLPFDPYRDLRPGDTGSDVTAIQQALKDLGRYSGQTDGEFGAKTSAAVRELYSHVGMTPPKPADEAAAALADAEQALQSAKSQATDDSPLTDSQLAVLQSAVAEARRAADTPLPMAEIMAVPPAGTTVVSVTPVGTILQGDQASVATLRSGVPTATARVGVKDAGSFAVGTAVTIARSSGDGQANGVVAAISDFKAADAANALPGYDLTVTYTEGTPDFGDGEGIVVRPAGQDEVRSGLAVPLVAVRQDNSSNYVLLPTASGTRRVDVDVVMTDDGYALVSGDGLDEGDVVLISEAT